MGLTSSGPLSPSLSPRLCRPLLQFRCLLEPKLAHHSRRRLRDKFSFILQLLDKCCLVLWEDVREYPLYPDYSRDRFGGCEIISCYHGCLNPELVQPRHCNFSRRLNGVSCADSRYDSAINR